VRFRAVRLGLFSAYHLGGRLVSHLPGKLTNAPCSGKKKDAKQISALWQTQILGLRYIAAFRFLVRFESLTDVISPKQFIRVLQSGR
jgi:hypothetical protein